MSNYRDEIQNLEKQRKVFKLIRNICIPILAVTFVAAAVLLGYDIYVNGENSGSVYYLIAQLLTILAQLAFDGMAVGIIFNVLWSKRIESRKQRIKHGYASEDDWNNSVVHETPAETSEDKKESKLKDYTNPDDPFH